ncbi:HEAT domain protein repeat-containing protein [Nostoc sp. NIES-4103]|nr:HEAT domain protein repeat-containing protein [Nostoc sp. NIES-4103]
MVEDKSIDFQAYLQFLCVDDTYREWQEFYTPIDALDRQRIELKKSRRRLDLGLMVQTIQPPQPQGQPLEREKIEWLNVLEGLRKYAANHVLLKGKPGSGKSTALKRLLWEEAEKAKTDSQAKIPVLVQLRRYKTSVLGIIQDFLIENQLLLSETQIENLLFTGRFLLLIDGLNELPNEEARRDLYGFREKYFRVTPMIFTTRDLGVDLGIEKKLEMQPLTEGQMQQFVRAYLPEVGDEMLRRLGGRLRELGETPLLLSMLCEVFDYSKQIPTSLGSLFRWFSGEYDKLKVDVPISEGLRNWQSELLQHLAFVMMQGDSPTEFRLSISKQQARNILTEFLQGKVAFADDCARRWLEDLLRYHLIQLRTDDQIEFRHQLLQEYYAAEKLFQLLSKISDERLKRDYLNYLKWTESLALMLALVDNEKQTVQIVNLALEVDLMLGARLAGEARKEFQEKTVDLVLGLNTSQELKFYLLGLTGSEKALPSLLKAWNSRDYKNDYIVAEALAYVGYDEAMSTIIQLEDEYISSLAEAEQYEDDYEDYLYHNIVSELESITLSDTAIDQLLILLKNQILISPKGSDYYLKGRNYQAKKILGEKVFNQVISILLQALNHQDFRVRYHAAFALGNIGSEMEVVALIEAVKDENCFVRSMAIEALGELGSIKAVSALIEAVSDDKPFIRSRAVEALGKIGSDKAVSTLIKALNDEKYFVRLKVAEALGKIGNKTAVTALIGAFNDQESEVRLKVIEALGKIGGDTAIPALIKALNDEQSDICSTAKEGLISIRNSLVKEVLQNIYNSPYDYENTFVSETAANKLAQICNDCLQCILSNSNLMNKWKDLSIHLNSKISSNNDLIKCELLYQIWEVLLTLMPELATNQKDMILVIQKLCKFYNYAIFSSPPSEEEKQSDPLLDTLNRLNQTMSETPKVQMNFYASINSSNVAGNVEGDNINTQNNYPTIQNIAEVEKVLQQLLEQIEQTKPTPIQAQLIVDQAVEKHPVLKDAQIIEQAIKRYPPLKVRLQRVIIAAGIETVKVLFAPAGIVIEAIRAWTEPE